MKARKQLIVLLCVVCLLVLCGIILLTQKTDFRFFDSRTLDSSMQANPNDTKQSARQTKLGKVENVFLDNAHIEANAKTIMIIFGANDCEFCEKLKDVIADSKEIQTILSKDFSSYYVNISYNTSHSFGFSPNPESSLDSDSLSTKALARRYNVVSTPTIVFLSPNGREIFAYSGFMEADKFKATLEFFANDAVQNMGYDGIARELLKIYEKK